MQQLALAWVARCTAAVVVTMTIGCSTAIGPGQMLESTGKHGGRVWPPDTSDAPPPVPPEGIVMIEVPEIVTTPAVTYRAAGVAPEGDIVAMDEPLPAKSAPDRPFDRALNPRPSATGSARSPRLAGLAPKLEPPLAPPSLSSSFDSTTFDDNATNNGGFLFIPADPIAAVGPNHVMNVVNTTVRIHTKTGTKVLDTSLANFFSTLSPTTFTFDPKVLYDQYAGRFVVVDLEQDTSPNVSRIFVAVSDDSDPTGTWYTFDIDAKEVITSKEHWADYPGFAVDEEAVYITANMFTFTGNGFGGVRLWIIDKGLAAGGFYDGGTAMVARYNPYAGGGVATTTQPAHVFGTSPQDTGTWLVSYSGLTDGTDEYLQVVRVDDPLGSPTFTQEFLNFGDVEDFSSFANAPQSGTATQLETNDRRALHAVWYADSLWMVASLSPASGTDAGQVTAAWWELDTTLLGSTAISDSGFIGGEEIATGTFTFFPSVAVNGAGQVAIGFSASDDSIFPGAYYTTRSAGDAAGTTTGSGVLRAGTDYYIRTFSGGSNRWGDYSGVAMDPADGCFWIYNKWAMTRGTLISGEDGRWATSFGRLCPSGHCAIDKYFEDVDFAGPLTEAAASTIRTGPGVAVTGGVVTLFAGEKITVGNGFSVDSGATFIASLGAGACP